MSNFAEVPTEIASLATESGASWLKATGREFRYEIHRNLQRKSPDEMLGKWAYFRGILNRHISLVYSARIQAL